MPRFRMHTDKRGCRTLEVYAAVGEAFDQGALQAFAHMNDVGLIVPSLCVRGATRRRHLRYEIGRLMSLGTYVHDQALRVSDLIAMLADIAAVVGAHSRHVRTPRICYEPRHVYVTSEKHLRFLCMPISPWEEGGASALELVRELNRLMRTGASSPRELALCDRLDRFVLSQGDVLSASQLKVFVRSELAGREECELLAGYAYDVGRGENCDVVVRDQPRVSRFHASLRCEQDAIYLTDKGSANGTFVAGVRLQPDCERRIDPGQSFMLADARFCVERAESAQGHVGTFTFVECA